MSASVKLIAKAREWNILGGRGLGSCPISLGHCLSVISGFLSVKPIGLPIKLTGEAEACSDTAHHL